MNKFTKAIAAMMLIVTAIVVAGCNKPDEPNNGGNNGNNDSDVRVTTYTPQDITATTAVCGGDAIVVQGLSLTEIGVCWSKEQYPTPGQANLSTTIWNEPFVCKIEGMEPGTKYYVRAYALRGLEYYYGEQKDFNTKEDYGYVDLDLPSGTLWATCNVGATIPEDIGGHFAWGEIQTKTISDCGWDTYKYCRGEFNQLTKYCNNYEYGYNGFSDDLIVLQPMDDAASVNWGEQWCMPTKAQWEELFQNTTNNWTIQNGVNGRLFMSTNGNSIFIPGIHQHEDSEYGRDSYPGFYWSSSLCTEHFPIYAWQFNFNSEQYKMLKAIRCGLGKIRAVRVAH